MVDNLSEDVLIAPAPAAAVSAPKFKLLDLLSPPVLCGFADSGAVLLFMRGLNISDFLSKQLLEWYALMTVGKLVLLALNGRNNAPLSGPTKWLIGSVIVMSLATMLTGIDNFGPYVAIIGFVVNLWLTCTLIGRSPLSRYLVGPVLIIAGSSAVHAVLCATHRMPSWYGRFLYFGWNQFNLGGEIEAVGCLAAALFLPRLLAVPVLAVILADMNFMQARSAMLVGLGAMIVVLVFDNHQRLSQRRAIILMFLGPVFALLLVALGAGGKLTDTISSALLLNDPHRGVASGGSGRSDLWRWSLQIFADSPIVGHNLSYFGSIGFIGSHNMFLYGLAQYGLMTFLFFGTLVYSYAVLARQNFYRFAVLLATLPLLLFNDRFVNLNVYPFMFFVLLTAASRETNSVAPSASPGAPYRAA
jgi:O-Antigen ligase